jgi:hypothetical protein
MVVSPRGGNFKIPNEVDTSWFIDQEDLHDVLKIEPGTVLPGINRDHGTAASGIVAAKENGYGCTGLAPDATMWIYPSTPAVEMAIAKALQASGAGDVILANVSFGGDPAETSRPIFDVVKCAIDCSVIVVEPAGNGGHDLDSDDYEVYRSFGDSGAIIVGGGTSDVNHNRVMDIPPGSSNYGSRVNIQAWGQNVVTLGYGNCAAYGGDDNQTYTADFSLTSAAAPMAAGACLSLQSYAVNRLCRRLSPSEMRSLLVNSGICQGGGPRPCAPVVDPIGTFVNMVEAIAQLKLLPSSCRFRRGDASNSGVVDVGDCSFITNWLCCGGPTPPCLEAADANDDGSNEPSDATYICNWLFSGGPAPPSPGPVTCGPDPFWSPENLGCGSYTSCP